MPPKTLRNVCFTVNNYTDQQYSDIKEYLTKACRYWIIGKEGKGAEATPHLQGYAEFKSSRKFTAVKKAIPGGHIEPRKKTAWKAANYCKKEGDWVEHGTLSKQGDRTDLAALAAAATDLKVSAMDAFQDNPVTYFKFYRNFNHVRQLAAAQDTKFTPMDVRVYWGAAGTGKTRAAHTEFPDIYMVPIGGGHSQLWFDGIGDSKAILFDDFYGGAVKYGLLLKLLDGYRFKLPIKGGFAWKSYTTVIITSNADPQSWYPEGLSPALKRRIKQIIHYPAVRRKSDVADGASRPVVPGDSYP